MDKMQNTEGQDNPLSVPEETPLPDNESVASGETNSKSSSIKRNIAEESRAARKSWPAEMK
eukprot:1560567-Pleurochrysis_carterae.AAC.1